MIRKNYDFGEDESVIEERKHQVVAPVNLLSYSCYDTEILSAYNEYESVKVSGPKWSNEAG